MSERNEVSRHEVEVWRIMRENPAKWLENAAIAKLVDGVSARTVRAKTIKLVELGLLDQAEVFPAHRYRLSEKAMQRNRGYVQRLEFAAGVFEIKLP